MGTADHLKFPKSMYDVFESSQVFNLREARAEYSRLRSIARKRLNRLRESEYAERFKHRPDFASLPKNASEIAVRRALADVASFVSSKSGSIKGLRSSEKKYLQTVRDQGYTFVNKKNVNQFRQFMAAAKKHYREKRVYDSEEYVEIFEKMVSKKADIDSVIKNFDRWVESGKPVESPAEKKKRGKRKKG